MSLHQDDEVIVVGCPYLDDAEVQWAEDADVFRHCRTGIREGHSLHHKTVDLQMAAVQASVDDLSDRFNNQMQTESAAAEPAPSAAPSWPRLSAASAKDDVRMSR